MSCFCNRRGVIFYTKDKKGFCFRTSFSFFDIDRLAFYIMLSKLAKEYKQILLTIIQVISLIALCVAAGVAIVLPLWKWAVVSPQSYSAVIIAIIAIFIVVSIVNNVTRMSKMLLLRRAIQIALTAIEVFFFINQVFNMNRLFAFISLAIYALVISFISLSMKTASKEVK